MKRLIFTFLLAVVSFTVFGQQQQVQKQAMDVEKVKEMRIAIYTDKLKLTPKQATSFWPIYNDYVDRSAQLRKDQMKLIRLARNGMDELNDDQAYETLNKIITINFQLENTRKQLYKKLETVLNKKQLLILYQSEYDFYKLLLENSQPANKK